MAHTLVGTVTSDQRDKTITVSIVSRETHPLYRKQYSKTRKYTAHDAKNEAHVDVQKNVDHVDDPKNEDHDGLKNEGHVDHSKNVAYFEDFHNFLLYFLVFLEDYLNH